MILQQGKQYVVSLRADGLLSGIDWIPGAMAQKYPAVVVWQGPGRHVDGGMMTDVVLVWKGIGGGISTGDVVSAVEIPGVPSAQATVTGVAESTSTPEANPSTGWELAAAITILAFVAYAVFQSEKRSLS